jgi:prevent-host-death family protein
MSKSCSIAEARHNLAALVHELEQGSSIQLTRRGHPVAVLLSIHEYERLQTGTVSFWNAYQSFCATVDLAELDIEPAVFAGVRDQANGREVSW